MTAGLLALYLALPAAGAASAPDDAQKVRSAELSVLYETAMQHYKKAEYSRAIGVWREVLQKAPDQSSAEKWIEVARAEIDKRDKERQRAVQERIEQGAYADALVALQPLLEADPMHPFYNLLQARLDRVSFIVPQASTATKAWQAVARSMPGYLGPKDELDLAYDGLRWARELEPDEVRFSRLIALLLTDAPSLSQDAVPPGAGVLQHKTDTALGLIYDGRYARAAALLERVVRINPEDLTALKRLGSAYYALQDEAKARRYWQRAQDLNAEKDAELEGFLERLGAPPQKE